VNKSLRLIPAPLILVCVAHVSAMAQAKPLVAEWVNEDIEGVSAIVELIPFERQNIEGVKARLRKDWHVEETNLGFGGKYLELEKGRGYAKGYVHALIYNGRVAQYEVGIESYSEEWPKIRQRVSNRWKESKGPEVSEEEHGLVFRRTQVTVRHKYQANVAAALGRMNDTSVPSELLKSYTTLTDPMENSTLSGTHQNDDISALVNSNRVDLLENVLRAYNPGGRVMAALALLEVEKTGIQLPSNVRQSIDKVLNLNIELHACVFDMCSNPTAREALRWFDSGLAFPRPKVTNERQKKP
jgi:hypothetical protein